MAKAKKIGYYNLNKNFAVTPSTGTTYTYTNPTNTSLVMWARMKSTGPEDLGPNNLSPLYENTPNFSEFQLGNKTYPAAQFNDVGEDSASVTSTSGLLSFSSAANGATPTITSDRPFSVSLWVKLDDLHNNQYLFSKQGASGSDREYNAAADVNGTLYFILEDESATNDSVLIVSDAAAISAGVWTHLVFTYSGQGGSSADDGMNIYANGTLLTMSSRVGNVDYKGMKPSHSTPLYMGGHQAGDNEIDGWVSEFAIWSKELTDSEVKAVYYATTMGSHELISGYLNNPPRVILRERDNQAGSYPTVLRTGDADFKGGDLVSFEDTDTVTFNSAYLAGEIDFVGVPMDGDTITLYTLKLPSSIPKVFEFQKGIIQSTPGSTLVQIPGAGITKESAAFAFAQSVNTVMSASIEAVPMAAKVRLRYHNVNHDLLTGSLILSSSVKPSVVIPITIKKFSQLGPKSYSYPFVLDTNSKYINESIAPPNFVTAITAPAIMKTSVSDVKIKQTVGTSFGPFIENRILIEDTPFFNEGTDPKILEGFNQRLASKVAFSVDISPTEATEIGWATGSISQYANSAEGLTAGINSGIGYFNFKDKKWEVIGDLTTGSNVDHLNSEFSKFTDSMLAISPPVNYSVGDGRDKSGLVSTVGLPDPCAGFPIATKFNATDSQLLKMSEYITAPFLLEKVVIEVSGALGTLPMYVGSDEGLTNTVMLLNQYKNPVSNYYKGTALYQEGNTPPVKKAHQTIIHSTRNKDIILYGRVATYATGSSPNTPGVADRLFTEDAWAAGFGKNYEASFPVNLNSFGVYGGVPLEDSPAGGTGGALVADRQTYTGSIKLEIVPKTMIQSSYNSLTFGSRTSAAADGNADVSNYYSPPGSPAAGNDRRWSFGNTIPSRNLHDISSGRSYTRGVIGSQITKEVAGTNLTIPLNVWQAVDSRSPYLLMPDDNLVLAWVNQSSPNPGSLSKRNDWASESFVAHTVKTKLVPGVGKITFYGSLIADSKPAPVEINQQLTSDALHEDVRDDISPYGDSRCLDQFDVEPITSFRKGFLDNITAGVMGIPFEPSKGLMSASNGKLISDFELAAAPISRTARQVVASVVSGQAGITGSLQRFVRIPDNNLTYYDSTAPSIWSYVNFHQIGQFGQNHIVLWNPSPGSLTAPADQRSTVGSMTWPMAFPFEGAMGEVKRKNSVKGMVTDHTGSAVSPVFRTYMSGAQTRPSPAAGYELWMDALHNAYDPSSTSIPDYQSLMYFFGFGDRGVSGKTASDEAVDTANAYKRSLMGYGKMASTFVNNAQSLSTAARTLTIDNVRIAPRGTKYGLINSYPHSPSSVFRYDTYGQFRDRLEQGYHTRFYDDGILTETPVSVTFVDRDGDRGVDPLNTNSQNLSIFATSSVPYFDGLTKERISLEPDLVSDSQVTISYI